MSVDPEEQERRMQWLLDEHDRMKEVIAELQKPEPEPVACPYISLATVAVLLSYLYGITLGVYVCPK